MHELLQLSPSVNYHVHTDLARLVSLLHQLKMHPFLELLYPSVLDN
jgi:hypothetical protein